MELTNYLGTRDSVLFRVRHANFMRRSSKPPDYTKRKLHRAPLDEAQQPLPWSTARIMSRACKELNKIARRRADQLLHCTPWY